MRSAGLDIVLLDRKQAVAQLPSAVRRRRLQFRQNGRLTEAMNPTVPPPSAKAIFGGWRARIGVGNCDQRGDLARERVDDSLGQQHFPAVPQALRIERHELDIAHLESVLAREAGERHDIGLDQILYRDGIELDGAEAELLGIAAMPARTRSDRRGA